MLKQVWQHACMRSWRKLHYKICPEFLLHIQKWQEDSDMMLASTHEKYIFFKWSIIL
jgi:hypothetical protein